MTAYPCVECGQRYEQERRRASLYCPDCRAFRQNRRHAERNAKRDRRRDDVVDVLNQYTAAGMSEDYIALMIERADVMLDDPADDWQASPLPPLEGANSAAGPDEGTSTYWTDFREELEARSDLIATDPWWSEHPNWHVGMHDDAIPNTAYLKAS